MKKNNPITMEVDINVDMEKLEKIKNLLTEIKQLHDDIFGKQQND